MAMQIRPSNFQFAWVSLALSILSAAAVENHLSPSGAENGTSLLNTTITISRSDGGRIFEGIGAVSAGASSRLLIEYPQSQRREVLDYLFRPKYGAGFQHLKVEIGGEVNSTDGIELTHMRSRGDENYQRGYEWWLMEEAKRRNHDLVLDCLAWGAPGWVGGGKYYSQDMADYVAKFLAGAKRFHHLEIAYTGIWNETAHDSHWIKMLRRTLDQSGLQQVGIVAADDYDRDGWKIIEEMQSDPELRAAVARVGVHYRNAKSPPAAQTNGCPLWSSEDGPWRGDWPGALSLARTINRNYVTGKFTKTEIWSPVTAYYDSLPLPGSGVLRANEPWSGHYEVQPAVWAVAHTTQFAPPGWRYLDPACRLIDGGSVVALHSPQGGDLSVVIETADAKLPQTLEFHLVGWPRTTLHLWRTSKAQPFERLADLHPASEQFSLTIEPACIYSITTTTGQHKGQTEPPPSRSLPLPYADDFSRCKAGETPRLFSDQAGVFEVQKRADGQGNCLCQVLSQDGIQWPNHKDPAPETILGDLSWRDYSVGVDARIHPGSYAALLGRVTVVPNNEKPPSGYLFKVAAYGHWELRAVRTVLGDRPWVFHTSGDTGAALAEGETKLLPGQWHRLELGMSSDQITALLDGKTLATIHDATHSHGQAGLGCGWPGAEFAHCSIQPQVFTQSLVK